MIGRVFGQLTVLSRSARTGKNIYWDCLCTCGNAKSVSTSHLTRGHTKSCGCLQKAVTSALRTKHGGHGTTTYKSWTEMLYRCNNPKNKFFRHYGGRGIRVCERWLDFANFLSDMGEKPSGNRVSLDRINNDGNYEPGNCRWADQFIQCNNQRTTRHIEFNGRVKTVSGWAAELGVPRTRLCNRLQRGWPIERVLTP